VTLKKGRLKNSIKSSAETDCRGHSSIEEKILRLVWFFFQGENKKEFQDRVP